MANLPELSTRVQQLHELRWKELRKTHGFTGAHLKWHESPAMRRAAAPRRESLCPPPPIDIFDRNGPLRTTFYGSNGEEVSWEEWKRQRPAVWAARESDPAVIDSIGVAQTVALAKERFTAIIGDYLLAWAEANGEADFATALEEIRSLVLREVTGLWETDEWHRAWFHRACQPKVEQALTPLIEAEDARALRLKIQHLENPNVSLKALARADRNLSIAAMFDSSPPAADHPVREPAPAAENIKPAADPQAMTEPALVGVQAVNAVLADVMAADVPRLARPRRTPRRTPDLKTSRERVALHDRLSQELAIIKRKLQAGCDDPLGLKREYPNFQLWQYLSDGDINELDENFRPKGYAERITLGVFGVTSPATLKKDRRKIARAKKTTDSPNRIHL